MKTLKVFLALVLFAIVIVFAYAYYCDYQLKKREKSYSGIYFLDKESLNDSLVKYYPKKAYRLVLLSDNTFTADSIPFLNFAEFQYGNWNGYEKSTDFELMSGTMPLEHLYPTEKDRKKILEAKTDRGFKLTFIKEEIMTHLHD